MNALDFILPRWMRMSAVSYLRIQFLLRWIAEKDWDSLVRRKAVEKLTDQALLERIGRQDKDVLVRAAAVGKLEDQNKLRTIAIECTKAKDERVRMAAVRSLDDQALLYRIAGGINSRNVCWAAVDALEDQDALANVARFSSHRDVAKAALAKITDQALLEQIAQASDIYVVRAAIKRIENQSFLVQFALSNADVYPRRDAKAKVQSQTDQARIELCLPAEWGQCPDAVKDLIADQAWVKRTAQQDAHPNVRRAAVDKLEDQDALAEIAQHDDSELVRRDAIYKKRSDQALLERIAQQDRHESVREYAVFWLRDQDALAKIAQHDDSECVRLQAVKNLLAKFAAGGETTAVQSEAIDKMNDPKLLCSLIDQIRDQDSPDDLTADALVAAIKESIINTFTEFTTTSPVEATEALFGRAVPATTPIEAEDRIRSEYERLQHTWYSRAIVKDTGAAVRNVVLRNLERIAGEPGFLEFVVSVVGDRNVAFAQVNAIFRDAFVPVRVWRGQDKVYACGNALFTA